MGFALLTGNRRTGTRGVVKDNNVCLPTVQPPKGATHQEIAQACWDAVEPTIRKNPSPWLWMYKHWRYRPAGAKGYPPYAQESPAFDQIASRPDYAKLDRSRIFWSAPDDDA